MTNLNAMGIENVAVVCGDGGGVGYCPGLAGAAAPEGTFIVALVAGGGTKCLAFEARENYLQSVWIGSCSFCRCEAPR
ncbi:MAG: hypothetical protein E2O76_12740 [Caldithrix sp.]|nr:MAG: hypothetical protein E2O76_12740 [Caldithrix sp.]